MKKFLMGAVALAALAIQAPAFANDYEPDLRALVDERLRAIATNPVLVEAIKAQNVETAGFDQDAIDAKDQTWRDEAGQSPAPMIDPLLATEASQFLAGERDAAEGLITEAFAMDAKGLNVALSDVTSDYWQGDEAKWQQTYAVGADAVHLGEVEFDESSQTYQAQVSLTITDPETNAPIGAITFGINAEMLE